MKPAQQNVTFAFKSVVSGFIKFDGGLIHFQSKWALEGLLLSNVNTTYLGNLLDLRSLFGLTTLKVIECGPDGKMWNNFS